MPTGPKGQKRPADVIGKTARGMQITMSKAEEEMDTNPEMPSAVRDGVLEELTIAMINSPWSASQIKGRFTDGCRRVQACSLTTAPPRRSVRSQSRAAGQCPALW